MPVKCAKNVSQLFIGDVGIDLRGTNAGMSEEFLHGTDISSCDHKICGK